MNSNAALAQEPKKKRERKPIEYIEQGIKKKISVVSNANLYNRIIEVANIRRLSFSNTVRLLLNIGLREWELNRIAGRNKKDIEADYNKRLAEAQAIATRKAEAKQRRGKQDTAQAVTPMLFGIDQENEE